MRSVVLIAAILMLPIMGLAAAAGLEGLVARGSYLVHHVGMCVQCHTPRDASGEIDRTRLLKGARIPVSSPFPTQRWAVAAPTLAGLRGWGDQDAVTLLTTGRLAGYTPDAPMPPFRLTREDAEAAVAYLRSLP
jgi:mono/diheme cytochrome c family protein